MPAYTPAELLRAVASGALALGPGDCTVFFPLLLPFDCCAVLPLGQRTNRIKACGLCGRLGWTHNEHWPPADYRCFDCQTICSLEVIERLRSLEREEGE